MEDIVLETIEGRVGILTLNRPESLNALNDDLMRKLPDAIRKLADNDAVGCVVLTGAGRGFCAGGDRNAIKKSADDRASGAAPPKSTLERRVRWLKRCAEASRILYEMPKPAIAMINGACAGAGVSLAAACDFRYAAASANFAPAYVSLGMPMDYGGAWLLTRILGTAKARQFYFIEEKRSAAQMLEFGLLTGVHEDAALREETLKLAHRLAALPPSGLAYTKANLNAALTDSFADSLDRESLNMMLARNALIEARKAAPSS